MSLESSSEKLNQQPEIVAPQEPPAPSEALELIVGKLDSWLEAAIELLPNFVVAIVILLIFWGLSKILKKVVQKTLGKTSLPTPLLNILVTGLGVMVMAAGLFIALGVLGLDKTVMSLLAGVGIVGLALGFAFQDSAANLIAGVLLSVRRPIRVGDIVETNDHFGTVEEINLRATIVRTPTAQTVFIPNKEVFEKPIVNYSMAGCRRVDLEVGVSYGDDLEKVKELTLATVEALEQRDPERPVEFFYRAFGSSSIDFVVRFWIDFDKQSDYLGACSEAIMAIKKVFDDNAITIPFPIRTLDFGIVGGEPLSDHIRSLSRVGDSP